MTSRATDLEQVRRALRTLSRGSPLIIAERAAELVPPAELKVLLGNFINVEALTSSPAAARSLLDEVRDFYARSVAGQYYESFAVNWKNCTERSKGADAFMAEFDRLLTRCIRDAEAGPRLPTLQAFDLLFALLRHIDGRHGDVIFFADEGGSYEVGLTGAVRCRPTSGAWPRPLRPSSSRRPSTK